MQIVMVGVVNIMIVISEDGTYSALSQGLPILICEGP